MTQHEHRTIAIIGGGIMGLSTACSLLQGHNQITLYDPNGFPSPHSASAIAGGMLAPYSEIEHMDETWIKAGLHAIQFWRDFADQTNNTIDFQKNGSLLIAHEGDQHILERFQAHLPSNINQDTGHAATHKQHKHFAHSLFLAGEAHLNPHKTMTALVTHMKGHKDRLNLRKEKADPSALSKHYDTVLDCRGMNAAQNDPELRGVKGEIITIRNAEYTLEHPVRIMHPRYPLYIVPHQGHVFSIGATNIESASPEKTTSLRSAMELMSAAYALHPSFGDAEILEINADTRPAYPNNLPRVTIKGNIISCNGLFRHGYLLAPAMAETVSAYLKGHTHEFFNLFTQNHKDNQHENNDQREREKLRRTA